MNSVSGAEVEYDDGVGVVGDVVEKCIGGWRRVIPSAWDTREKGAAPSCTGVMRRV